MNKVYFEANGTAYRGEIEEDGALYAKPVTLDKLNEELGELESGIAALSPAPAADPTPPADVTPAEETAAPADVPAEQPAAPEAPADQPAAPADATPPSPATPDPSAINLQ